MNKPSMIISGISGKIEGISEQTAILLTEAIKKFAVSTPFNKGDLKPVVRSFILRACYDLNYKKYFLYNKLRKSTFLTRWYYKRKYITVLDNLSKTEKALRDFDHE